ncbi:hypothetical protein [Saccharothrix luteola]|uniref:hypothetical protein n=1 Tax=Saccharothrix luteola TaxID=2893018 RepID=UPI001E5FC5DE|nr:hypothetical protein [Saccharothrix luteola]MCC8246967.1 hypothetical protein [Saccharothrix luteola]
MRWCWSTGVHLDLGGRVIEVVLIDVLGARARARRPRTAAAVLVAGDVVLGRGQSRG